MGLLTGILGRFGGHASAGEVASYLVEEASQVAEEAAGFATRLSDSKIVRYSAGALVAYKAYQLFFAPLRHVQRNHEVGYILAERQSRVERANEVRKRRKVGDLPPVYPNGWFRLIEASALKPGDVHAIHVLGLDLAVFRTESGRAAAIDAYCPHLGANIAAGGEVCGETVKCPFHGWAFDTEGKCVDIPYASGKIPSSAKVDKYTVLEVNDQILVWYDAEGRPPMWFPPEIDGVNDGLFSWRGITQHFINAHIQEVPENAADIAHLNYLHGPILLNGVDLRETHKGFSLRVMRHEWDAKWAPCPAPNKHLSVLTLNHKIYLFGYHLPVLDLEVIATQVGPGLVYLTFDSLLGRGCFTQTLTPVEPLLQELTHCMYAAWTVPTILAKIYTYGEASQVDRDVMVWNNKRYNSKPLLVKEDELIGKHRRWYSQFYSENSPTYSSHVDDMSW